MAVCPTIPLALPVCSTRNNEPALLCRRLCESEYTQRQTPQNRAVISARDQVQQRMSSELNGVQSLRSSVELRSAATAEVSAGFARHRHGSDRLSWKHDRATALSFSIARSSRPARTTSKINGLGSMWPEHLACTANSESLYVKERVKSGAARAECSGIFIVYVF
jgi:hypothetical protein